MLKYGSNDIGRMFFGSNEIGKAYYGSNLVFQKGSQPQPGVSIPYIRGGSATSYIDTGITADNTTRVIVWARNWNPGSDGHTYLFGCRVGNQNQAFGLGLPNNAETGKLRIAYGNANTDLSDKWRLFSWYHKYELNGNELYVDNALVGSGTQSTFSNNLNIFLFGLNNNGTYGGNDLPIDICACKIYKNNVLVRDFTAVNTPSIGLYDAVSDTVFTNDGSGSLTYGTFDMSAYTPLEYVDSNGGAHFDSGAYGGYSVPVVIKFRATQANNGSPFGYRGNNDWMEFDMSASGGITAYYRLANDGTWRKLYTNSNASNVVDQDIVFVKGITNAASLYKNNTLLGSTISPTSSTSYVTSGTLAVSALKLPDRLASQYYGRLYYVGFGKERSLVPAKRGTSIGMYDTYNDVFYVSVSEVSFSEPTN